MLDGNCVTVSTTSCTMVGSSHLHMTSFGWPLVVGAAPGAVPGTSGLTSSVVRSLHASVGSDAVFFAAVVVVAWVLALRFLAGTDDCALELTAAPAGAAASTPVERSVPTAIAAAPSTPTLRVRMVLPPLGCERPDRPPRRHRRRPYRSTEIRSSPNEPASRGDVEGRLLTPV